MKARRLILLIIFYSSSVIAWPNWMLTPDQQAFKAWQNDDFKKAEQKFTTSEWQAVANYRLGNYAKAQKILEHANNSTDIYNLANSYAKQGQYKTALQLYKKTLAINPNDLDAKFNYKLMQKLLKQQQKKQKQEQNKDTEPKKQSQKKHDNQQQQAKHEDKQAKKQLLQLIPDDIHGILRQQLWRDHLLKNQQGQQNE